MSTQMIAKVFGAVFVLVGVLGMIPGVGTMGMDPVNLLGLFPVNLVHNLVHIAFGVWGLMAAKDAMQSTNYCKIGGVIYLLLAALGFIGATSSGFGLVPLGGNDTFLHLVLGAVLAYFGFMGGAAKA